MNKPYIIEFPKIVDERGNLSFFESNSKIPFTIQRTYWIYDVPGGEIRGSHAYRQLEEVIIALSGSFDVVLNDGKGEFKYTLNRSYKGLFIPRLMWRRIENFSTNSLALIVANDFYNPDEYIRDMEEFKELIKFNNDNK